jgi:predicted enzyme related to lactoylglutathione lyase
MDLETVSADEFGKSLTGVGVNLLTADVRQLAALLVGVFGATAHRLSDDFAIIRFGGMMMQLHHDATYGSHPMHGLLPENPPRGQGVQLFFFGADPDVAMAEAKKYGGSVLEQPSNKPHGLYEGTILSAEGYAFTAALPERG